jgi:hypothetical protein
MIALQTSLWVNQHLVIMTKQQQQITITARGASLLAVPVSVYTCTP